MNKCLTYMSSLVGPDMYMIIVVGFILLPIMVDNILLIMIFTWGVNALSLSLFGNSSNILYKMDGRNKLTLSLPLSRKTIYDTRMYFVGALYLAGILISSIAYIPHDIYVYYFCVATLLLIGHTMCALCIRKPYFQILSGIPAFIVLIKRLMYDRQDFWSFVVDEIEPVIMLRVCMGIICIVILVIDILVWRYERRIFINGSPKGNVIRKEKRRTNEKYYGIEKKKIIIRTIIALVIFGAPISASLSKDFMLRAAVFLVSPQSALTMEYEYYKNLSDSDNAKLYIITKNIPIEKETQGQLYTWVVYNYGPFHFAKYYGEG